MLYEMDEQRFLLHFIPETWRLKTHKIYILFIEAQWPLFHGQTNFYTMYSENQEVFTTQKFYSIEAKKNLKL